MSTNYLAQVSAYPLHILGALLIAVACWRLHLACRFSLLLVSFVSDAVAVALQEVSLASQLASNLVHPPLPLCCLPLGRSLCCPQLQHSQRDEAVSDSSILHLLSPPMS